MLLALAGLKNTVSELRPGQLLGVHVDVVHTHPAMVHLEGRKMHKCTYPWQLVRLIRWNSVWVVF